MLRGRQQSEVVLRLLLAQGAVGGVPILGAMLRRLPSQWWATGLWRYHYTTCLHGDLSTKYIRLSPHSRADGNAVDEIVLCMIQCRLPESAAEPDETQPPSTCNLPRHNKRHSKSFKARQRD
jgi:hypothetical protein